eukprot:Opistho-1_new@62335
MVLGTWRERLPNKSDEITVWNEVFTWRHHVFTAINSLLQPLAQDATGANSGNATLAFIGYHETAWTINRFAHVARKHSLLDVCLTSLNKIYTLPNIEINDAFLKLREQAKCHFQLASDYRSGLDIINSTNLNYFNPQQKAEFFVLKGCFQAKMGQPNEAKDAFSSAMYIHDGLAKGWVAWGSFCEAVFMESRQMAWAEYALTCFFQAVKNYPERRARRFIAKILWLLTFDDANKSLTAVVDKNIESVPADHFVLWIPQLLSCMLRPESGAAQSVLKKIVRTHVQALYY